MAKTEDSGGSEGAGERKHMDRQEKYEGPPIAKQFAGWLDLVGVHAVMKAAVQVVKQLSRW